MKQIYFTLAHQHLTYCSAIWGGAYKTYINNLFVAQKKLLRVIFHKSKYDHTDPLFHEHKILKVSDTLFFQAWIFVFKSPFVYPTNNNFEFITGTASRRPQCLAIPRCRTSHAQQNISVRGTRCWNSLPQEQLRIHNSLSSFKYHLKQHIFSNYYLHPWFVKIYFLSFLVFNLNMKFPHNIIYIFVSIYVELYVWICMC